MVGHPPGCSREGQSGNKDQPTLPCCLWVRVCLKKGVRVGSPSPQTQPWVPQEAAMQQGLLLVDVGPGPTRQCRRTPRVAPGLFSLQEGGWISEAEAPARDPLSPSGGVAPGRGEAGVVEAWGRQDSCRLPWGVLAWWDCGQDAEGRQEAECPSLSAPCRPEPGSPGGLAG